MSIDAYGIAMIGVGGTLLGTLVGCFITYKLARHLTRKAAIDQNFIVAGNEFKKTWISVYLTAYKWKSNPSLIIGDDFIVRHIIDTISTNTEFISSAIAFSRFLNRKKRNKFEIFCNRILCTTKDEIDHKCIELFFISEKTSKEAASNNFFNTIDEMIKFTET